MTQSNAGRLELPGGYWIEGSALKKDDDGVVTIAHFTQGPMSKFNRQKREEFAAAMNATPSATEAQGVGELVAAIKDSLGGDSCGNATDWDEAHITALITSFMAGQSGWQDIATAKKEDLKHIILGRWDNGAWHYVVRGYWGRSNSIYGPYQSSTREGWWAENAPTVPDLNRMERCESTDSFIGEEFAPTHWIQDLPTPSSVGKSPADEGGV